MRLKWARMVAPIPPTLTLPTLHLLYVTLILCQTEGFNFSGRGTYCESLPFFISLLRYSWEFPRKLCSFWTALSYCSRPQQDWGRFRHCRFAHRQACQRRIPHCRWSCLACSPPPNSHRHVWHFRPKGGAFDSLSWLQTSIAHCCDSCRCCTWTPLASAATTVSKQRACLCHSWAQEYCCLKQRPLVRSARTKRTPRRQAHQSAGAISHSPWTCRGCLWCPLGFDVPYWGAGAAGTSTQCRRDRPSRSWFEFHSWVGGRSSPWCYQWWGSSISHGQCEPNP